MSTLSTHFMFSHVNDDAIKESLPKIRFMTSVILVHVAPSQTSN